MPERPLRGAISTCGAQRREAALSRGAQFKLVEEVERRQNSARAVIGAAEGGGSEDLRHSVVVGGQVIKDRI